MQAFEKRTGSRDESPEGSGLYLYVDRGFTLFKMSMDS